MSGWTIAWILWGAAFLAIELPAVFNAAKGDTLSEHVWRYLTRPFGTKRADAATWAGRAGVLVLLVWLIGHFEFGIWTL